MSRNYVSSVAIFSALLIFHASLNAEKSDRLLVRITSTPEKMLTLSRRPLDFASMAQKTPRDAIVTEKELVSLLSEGYQVEILQRESDLAGQSLDPFYHTLEETHEYLQTVERLYPYLAKLHTIGKSTRFSLPIWALKISDNPDEDEDEPAVLIDAMHHAREPLGNEICLAFIDYLISRYGWDERVTSWVNDFEIWVIPVMNPEGYKYLIDNSLASPWWRKNLRDNDLNGAVNLDYDGVDLNRNYDLNWTYAGSSSPADWTYRGPSPFSEDETRAKRDLALRERFAVAITYHSYGETIMYQWSWPGTDGRAPDHNLLRKMASEMAGRIQNLSGMGTYTYSRQTAANQSSPWIYAVTGTLEFLVETGTSFIPLDSSIIRTVVETNLEGLFYLLERLRGPGIAGRVIDRKTGSPLEALVSIVEIDDFSTIEPRKSHPQTGRFTRLLEPGKYTLRVWARGFNPARIPLNIGSELLEKDIIMIPLRDRKPADRSPRK
ncbi:MAG: M14 family zinc carboxypeptidase [Clostridiales bacterium]|nr:M14 family zinc carboxypeptidase [Clostridiales bacterium]